MITEAALTLGGSLAELAAKETASIVAIKIQSIRDSKKADEVRKTYDELLNQVLQERGEAVRIAQAYQEKLERIEISDEDIKHLHATVSQLLEVLEKFSPNNTSLEAFKTIQELINIDTLKTMQLLGFNYKAAIGEPLTQLCAEAISSLGKKNNGNKNQQKKQTSSGNRQKKEIRKLSRLE